MKPENFLALIEKLNADKPKYNVDYHFKEEIEMGFGLLVIHLVSFVLNGQLYYIKRSYHYLNGNEYELYKSRFNQFIFRPEEKDIRLIDSLFSNNNIDIYEKISNKFDALIESPIDCETILELM